MMKRYGKIVIFNGVSGTGKSTLCNMIKSQTDEIWLHWGIDQFGAMFDFKYVLNELMRFEMEDDESLDRVTAAPHAINAWAGYHEGLANFSRRGINVVADHILWSCDSFPMLQNLVKQLNGLPVVLIGLHCALEISIERIGQRTDHLAGGNGHIDTRFLKFSYSNIHKNVEYDLEFDTATISPEKTFENIMEHLSQGYAHTACSNLAQKFADWDDYVVPARSPTARTMMPGL